MRQPTKQVEHTIGADSDSPYFLVAVSWPAANSCCQLFRPVDPHLRTALALAAFGSIVPNVVQADFAGLAELVVLVTYLAAFLDHPLQNAKVIAKHLARPRHAMANFHHLAKEQTERIAAYPAAVTPERKVRDLSVVPAALSRPSSAYSQERNHC